MRDGDVRLLDSRFLCVFLRCFFRVGFLFFTARRNDGKTKEDVAAEESAELHERSGEDAPEESPG